MKNIRKIVERIIDEQDDVDAICEAFGYETYTIKQYFWQGEYQGNEDDTDLNELIELDQITDEELKDIIEDNEWLRDEIEIYKE